MMKFLSELNCRFRIVTGHQAREESAATGPAILVYHSVVDRLRGDGLDDYVVTQKQLDGHIRFFKSRGNIIALQELVNLVRTQSPLPTPCYVLTFDDALHCQLTFAKQVLDSHQVPWTIAVPAGRVDSGRSIWSYELRFLIRHCWNRPKFPSPTAVGVELSTSTEKERLNSAKIVFSYLINRCSAIQRAEYVEQLIDSVGRSSFISRFEGDDRFRMANWGELRVAATSRIEFASHGWDHVPHLNTENQTILHKEVIDSRDAMQKNLGIIPCTFAYPHGVMNSDSQSVVEQAGYTCGLTTESGRINSDVNLMRVPRFNAEYSTAVLRRHLSRASMPAAE